VKCKQSKNGEILLFNTVTSTYFQFHQTITLKCTTVKSAVKLKTKKVVVLHEYTQLRHASVVLSMMRCSKPIQPYHNVGRSRYEFFRSRPVAEFLCNFCKVTGFRSGCWGHRSNKINVGVSLSDVGDTDAVRVH